MVKEKNVIGYKKSIKDSPSICIKYMGTIEGFSSKEIYEALYDKEKRLSWDDLIQEIKVIKEKNDSDPEIVYLTFKVKD